ncbi:MAG: NAD-dependent epimerase/dehydratase family protein [Gemmatimonadota bacterium]
MTSRRKFLAGTAAAGMGLGLGGIPVGGEKGSRGEGGAVVTGGGPTSREVPVASRPLRILILGGTSFLGPAEVEYALARGHQVTLFNRGRTNPHLFPDAEKLVGDRAVPDYSALEGREWDAVIDNSANVASWVHDAVQVLESRASRYLFVSSISAHKDNSILGQTEDSPVFTREDYREAMAAGVDPGASFGAQKAEAERHTLEAFGEGGIVVRPGLIVGPGDRSDRFTYWPVRIDRGGEVLAPGDGTDWAQIIDVRDVGRFLVDLVEKEASGTFLATGPEAPLSMAGMLYGIRAITSSHVSFTWVDAGFLREHEVGAWMEMPVWVYPSEETRGFSSYDCSKAISAGLAFRPLADTARDTLEWWKARPEEEKVLRTGLAPEKEERILAAWRARIG